MSALIVMIVVAAASAGGAFWLWDRHTTVAERQAQRERGRLEAQSRAVERRQEASQRAAEARGAAEQLREQSADEARRRRVRIANNPQGTIIARLWDAEPSLHAAADAVDAAERRAATTKADAVGYADHLAADGVVSPRDRIQTVLLSGVWVVCYAAQVALDWWLVYDLTDQNAALTVFGVAMLATVPLGLGVLMWTCWSRFKTATEQASRRVRGHQLIGSLTTIALYTMIIAAFAAPARAALVTETTVAGIASQAQADVRALDARLADLRLQEQVAIDDNDALAQQHAANQLDEATAARADRLAQQAADTALVRDSTWHNTVFWAVIGIGGILGDVFTSRFVILFLLVCRWRTAKVAAGAATASVWAAKSRQNALTRQLSTSIGRELIDAGVSPERAQALFAHHRMPDLPSPSADLAAVGAPAAFTAPTSPDATVPAETAPDETDPAGPTLSWTDWS